MCSGSLSLTQTFSNHCERRRVHHCCSCCFGLAALNRPSRERDTITKPPHLSHLPSQRQSPSTPPPRVLSHINCAFGPIYLPVLISIAIATFSTVFTMATSTRQPFGEIGSSRLQVLQSAKNRQNGKALQFTCHCIH